MDNSYCLISVLRSNESSLCCYFYFNSKSYPIFIRAKYSILIYVLICKHRHLRRLSCSHYLYLGGEIYKAELSLLLDQEYTQN
nr:hypothetical protein [Gloiopeltis furcata]